jgi:hypothetical protein
MSLVFFSYCFVLGHVAPTRQLGFPWSWRPSFFGGYAPCYLYIPSLFFNIFLPLQKKKKKVTSMYQKLSIFRKTIKEK